MSSIFRIHFMARKNIVLLQTSSHPIPHTIFVQLWLAMPSNYHSAGSAQLPRRLSQMGWKPHRGPPYVQIFQCQICSHSVACNSDLVSLVTRNCSRPQGTMVPCDMSMPRVDEDEHYLTLSLLFPTQPQSLKVWNVACRMLILIAFSSSSLPSPQEPNGMRYK